MFPSGIVLSPADSELINTQKSEISHLCPSHLPNFGGKLSLDHEGIFPSRIVLSLANSEPNTKQSGIFHL